MKLSIFNSFISIHDKHTLIYNSFSDNFIVIKDQIKKISASDLPYIKSELPEFYEKLCKAGVIVEEETDETGNLRERIASIDNNADEYILHINPTLDCNLDCWYCYEEHKSGSEMAGDMMESTKKFIRNTLWNEEIKTFHLNFFGGEPLLHFNKLAKRIITFTEDLCKEYKKKLEISFTSNGTLLNDEIIHFLSKFTCGFQITLDGGESSHDKTRYYRNKKGTYGDIVSNILKLIDAGIGVIVRVNYTKNNIDDISGILDRFKDVPPENRSNLCFDFQRVWQDRPDKQDMTEVKIKGIREKFRKEKFKVLANHIPHNVRNSCYGDKVNHVVINYNGDVFGCTARDFTPDNRIGYLDAEGK